jgi:hypothetical protein
MTAVNRLNRLAMALVTTLGLVAAAHSAAQGSAAQLLPVDEAASQPAFFSFRAQLQESIARHDVDAVMAVVHPHIKASFGGDDGIDAFRKMWTPEEPGSKLWATLARVLALGGSFQGVDTFVAPYTFSRWPQRFDSFEHVALIAADVRIREAPRADAAVVTTRSFAILPVARTAPRADGDAWTAVQLDGRRVGYVSSQLARSPIDYRAIFTRSNGRWQLVTFLAGD